MEVPNRKHDIRPSILSIHPTMQCDYHCVGCYLKKDIAEDAVEKTPKFFIDLVKSAKRVGMKEVAIPINYVKAANTEFIDDPLMPDKDWNLVDKNIYYYTWLKKACLENGLEFTMTCNYDFFTSYPNVDLSGVSLVSVSMNDFVTGTETKRKECLESMRVLKKHIPIVNCNILLSDHMIKLLEEKLVEEILSVSDSVYFIVSKPLRISLREAGEWYSKLAEKFPIDSKRILMDTCIKYAFGLTNGICDKHQMIYVNPYGDIKMCSFDSKNLATLNKPEDFEEIYNKYFPQMYQQKCELMGM